MANGESLFRCWAAGVRADEAVDGLGRLLRTVRNLRDAKLDATQALSEYPKQVAAVDAAVGEAAICVQSPAVLAWVARWQDTRPGLPVAVPESDTDLLHLIVEVDDVLEGLHQDTVGVPRPTK